ncbi:MAG: magnesium transporter MgtC [Caulobacterales bacterium 68-7]|nr:MgtC/SapB family protein [Caulobacterales bacterium]OJU08739.1 MAG: magnesium transporter MgtC [Caulobacterales bacterium 68-7]
MPFATEDWPTVLSHLVNLAVAFGLALPIGWDNERHERSAGVRTFPLVAMASCGFVLVAVSVLGKDAQANARVMEGLITGVGFVGDGAIIKTASRASGTATAASLWVTGALGAAVGYGLYDIAAILSVVTFATLRGMRPLKEAAKSDPAPAGTTLEAAPAQQTQSRSIPTD